MLNILCSRIEKNDGEVYLNLYIIKSELTISDMIFRELRMISGIELWRIVKKGMLMLISISHLL